MIVSVYVQENEHINDGAAKGNVYRELMESDAEETLIGYTTH